MAAARKSWIAEAADEQERAGRERSSFLAYEDAQGQVVDFHALRGTFITNLSRSGVTPKTAQLLARHCDINLTMNTYTKLGVMDQAAAVEALPAIPSGTSRTDATVQWATGTDGKLGEKMVPTMVPRGAENGAIRLASSTLRTAPDCTENEQNDEKPRRLESAKNPEKTGAFCTDSQRIASNCTSGRGGNRTRTVVTHPGILSPVRTSRNEANAKELRDLESGEVPILVPSPLDGVHWPDVPLDLARVTVAWPLLPDAIRAAITTLVDAAYVTTAQRVDTTTQTRAHYDTE